MPTKIYKTPGVYVEEKAAFPPSVRGVATAVPIFIGYTEKAAKGGKPAFLKPIKINAMVDYEEVFGKGYPWTYELSELDNPQPPENDEYDFSLVDKTADPANPVTKYYLIKPAGVPSATKATLSPFNLYNSMKLFYANGGGDCYVVSVNPYLRNDGTTFPVAKDDLLAGLAAAGEQVGPTMTVIPDAISLASTGDKESPWVCADFAALITAMLEQCDLLKDRVAILDVYGSQYVATEKQRAAVNGAAVIDQFRTEVGEKYLSYGMAYFPFLETAIVTAGDIDYTSIANPVGVLLPEPTPLGPLQKVLELQNQDLYSGDTGKMKLVSDYILAILFTDPKDKSAVKKLNQNLVAALPVLAEIEKIIAKKEGTLPPSGAMAGVFTFADSSVGVWNAPANIALTAVDQPEFLVSASQQEGLNLPVDGKAVNALRVFAGRGTVVWGARTLDGNSDDYRYIQVRRTLIYLEQSIQLALNQFVFAPNDGNTWATVVAMISSFLQGVWSQGGLMGATASDAFSVECGLGSTMTPKDVLEGYMKIQITLQMIRPAEFIVLTFKQKMEGAG